MNRKDAEKNYKQALKNWNLASIGTDEKIFNDADNKLNEARKILVKCEIEQPTYKEEKKQNEVLRLRNRGLDV